MKKIIIIAILAAGFSAAVCFADPGPRSGGPAPSGPVPEEPHTPDWLL